MVIFVCQFVILQCTLQTNIKQQYSIDDVIKYVFDWERDFELSDDNSDVEQDHVELVQDGNQNNETLVERNNSGHDESSDHDVPVQNLVDNNKDVTSHEYNSGHKELELESSVNENCAPYEYFKKVRNCTNVNFRKISWCVFLHGFGSITEPKIILGAFMSYMMVFPQ